MGFQNETVLALAFLFFALGLFARSSSASQDYVPQHVLKDLDLHITQDARDQMTELFHTTQEAYKTYIRTMAALAVFFVSLSLPLSCSCPCAFFMALYDQTFF